MTADTVREVNPGAGLYRVGEDDLQTLLYIAQGRIPDRPLAHLAKRRDAEHPQGIIFAGQNRLEWSWVLNGDWLTHQRLELENALIAAHVFHVREVPGAQFLG